MIKYLINISFILILLSCDGVDSRLKIKNESPNNIIISVSAGADNILSFTRTHTALIGENKIISKRSNLYGMAWTEEIRSSKEKTLKIYIISADSIDKYFPEKPWDFYLSKTKIECVLLFTEAQLDSLHWQVNYYGIKK